ncbi:hypothetical protein Tco_0758974 [Tanacetum coccineum]
MAALKYKDDHNKIAYLGRERGCEDFTDILSYLDHSPLRYALTHAPPVVFDSLVKQFWATAVVRPNAAGSHDLVATIDGREVVVTESLIRTQLQFDDANGIFDMPNTDILEGMRVIGYPTDGTLTFLKIHLSPQWRFLVHTIMHCLSPKSGSWNQFPSSIATALICLSTAVLAMMRGLMMMLLMSFPVAVSLSATVLVQAEAPLCMGSIDSLENELGNGRGRMGIRMIIDSMDIQFSGITAPRERSMPDLVITCWSFYCRGCLKQNASKKKRQCEENFIERMTDVKEKEESSLANKMVHHDIRQFKAYECNSLILKELRVYFETSLKSFPVSAGGALVLQILTLLFTTRAAMDSADSTDGSSTSLSSIAGGPSPSNFIAVHPDSDDEVLAEIIFRGKSISADGVVLVDKLPDDEIVDPWVKI